MSSHQVLAATLLTTLLPLQAAIADEVRYYEQNGITYQETRRIVERPVYETQMQSTTRTVYRQQWVTEVRDSVHTSWVPVTEYECETYLVGRWNPFVEPYWATRLVPHTRWEQRTEVVKTPVTCFRWVPDTQTVQVPVTTPRWVQEEVVSRIALSGPRSTASGMAAAPQLSPWSPPGLIGGVARLDRDPPRYPLRSAWQMGPATR